MYNVQSISLLIMLITYVYNQCKIWCEDQVNMKHKQFRNRRMPELVPFCSIPAFITTHVVGRFGGFGWGMVMHASTEVLVEAIQFMYDV